MPTRSQNAIHDLLAEGTPRGENLAKNRMQTFRGLWPHIAQVQLGDHRRPSHIHGCILGWRMYVAWTRVNRR